MISLKRFLISDKEELQAALLRVILLLLEASGDHAADLDAEECAFHRSALRKVKEGFEQLSDAEDVSVLGGGAAKSIESYNRSLEKLNRGQGLELRGIISVMGDSLLKLSSGSELASKELRGVQRKLETASKVDDLQLLKKQLEESLITICSEAARQEKVASEIRSELERLLNREPQSQPAEKHRRSVVNEPVSREAQEAINKAVQAGDGHLLVMVLERLEMINARFGSEVGDQVLEVFRRHLTETLPKTDQVFLWRGPCVVAILNRPGGFDAVRAEARRLALSRLEHSVETGGRSVLLTLSRVSTVLPFENAADGAEMANQIDSYAAEHSRPFLVGKPAAPSLN